MIITPNLAREQTTCSCINYHIVRFQINFLKLLCTYAQMRQKQLDEMTRIIEARMKLKGFYLNSLFTYK